MFKHSLLLLFSKKKSTPTPGEPMETEALEQMDTELGEEMITENT